MFIVISILGLLIIGDTSVSQELSFPDDFIFGAATSSYQIEGAWDADGKGWSMWDHLVRTNPGHIADNTTGDIAANSYNNYKRDVQMLVELGVDAYRFSISWPRILPYGRPDYINPKGVEYYNNLIDELMAHGIKPFATIYHWELPQNLNEQGGWLNEEIADWIGDYSRVLFQLFGDRVKNWLTVNEPYIHCRYGYGYANHAPRHSSPGVGFYECIRNQYLANARIYHIYDDEFRATQNGEIGIVLSIGWAMVDEDTPENQQAVLDFQDFSIHLFMDPLFSQEGNFPQRVLDRVTTNSLAQGYNSSRLRPFTQTEADYIRGSSDFLALNHYSSSFVYRNSSLVGRFQEPSIDHDRYYVSYADPSWPVGANPWGPSYAPGFYHLLMYLSNNFDVKIYVTENGIASGTGLNDYIRTNYYRDYLTALMQALADGANVKGYFAWSLMDNFEWAAGYTMRFGIYEVDMIDPNRRRSPRKSALVYKNVIATRTVDYSFDPDPYANKAMTQTYVAGNLLLVTYLASWWLY